VAPMMPGPPGVTPPPPTGNLAQLCQSYCGCMSKGACTSRQPTDCMATCLRDGNGWALGCRIDKCEVAQSDYRDQITGDCLAAVGVNACLDK
jgi:hypothetical protein